MKEILKKTCLEFSGDWVAKYKSLVKEDEIKKTKNSSKMVIKIQNKKDLDEFNKFYFPQTLRYTYRYDQHRRILAFLLKHKDKVNALINELEKDKTGNIVFCIKQKTTKSSINSLVDKKFQFVIVKMKNKEDRKPQNVLYISEKLIAKSLSLTWRSRKLQDIVLSEKNYYSCHLDKKYWIGHVLNNGWKHIKIIKD